MPGQDKEKSTNRQSNNAKTKQQINKPTNQEIDEQFRTEKPRTERKILEK